MRGRLVSTLQGLALAAMLVFPVTAETRIEGLFHPAARGDKSGIRAFTIDPAALGRLKSVDGALRLEGVPTPEGETSLKLEAFSPFTDDARIVLKNGLAEQVLPLPQHRFYRGSTARGGAAFLRVSDSGALYGVLAGEGAGATVLNARGEAGYAKAASAGEATGYCPGGLPIEDLLAAPQPAPWQRRANKAALSQYRILVDMENRLFESVFRADPARAADYVADVFGVVSAVYQRDIGVSLAVSDLILWDEPAPFETTTVTATTPTYDDTLDDYSFFDRQRSGYSRHLSHLLSFKLPSYGSTIGLAFVGGLCSVTFKQGSSTLNGAATAFDPDTNEQDLMTVAHEIGHNFDAFHTNTFTIMDAISSTALDFRFSNDSITIMTNKINTASCTLIAQQQCLPESLDGQDPAQSAPITGAYFQTSASAPAFESFSGADEPIGRVRWWGTTGDCTRASDAFSIAFFEDDAGSPGSLVAQHTVIAAPLATGLSLDGEALLRYEADLPEVVDLAAGWISIHGLGDDLCAFAWAASTEGDSIHFLSGIVLGPQPGDLAFCLAGEFLPVPIAGLDCDAGALFSQALDPSSRADLVSNEGGERVFYDAFTGVDDTIHAVQWWGYATTDEDAACTRAPDTFQLDFFSGTTVPTTLVTGYEVTPQREELTVNTFPPLIRYTATLDPPLALSQGVLRIQGVGDTGCRFSWAVATEGAGGFGFTQNGQNFFFPTLEAAFCLLGEGAAEEGEGEGLPEGEGALEGEGELEGAAEGEGSTEGSLEGDGEEEGEGQAEGSADGEGEAGEGEGAEEGQSEGGPEGEGEDEGEVEGAEEGENEGEGEPLDPFEQLLYTFASADVNADSRVTLAEILAQLDFFTQENLDTADANGDSALSVAELLAVSSVQAVLSADTSGDYLLSLPELLRVVQLFNAGGYACAANPGATEDGYNPQSTPGPPACLLHALDRNGDNRLSLSELLRGIQVFSFAGYTFCDGQSEDNFCDRP